MCSGQWTPYWNDLCCNAPLRLPYVLLERTLIQLVLSICIENLYHYQQIDRLFHLQDANVCQKTATFCRFMIPGLFPWSLVTILMKVQAVVCRHSLHVLRCASLLMKHHCILTLLLPY